MSLSVIFKLQFFCEMKVSGKIKVSMNFVNSSLQ